MSFHIIYTIINYYFLNLRIDIYLNISDQNHGNVPISSPNPTSKISRRSSSNSSSRTKGTTEDEYIQRKPPNRAIIKQSSQEGKYYIGFVSFGELHCPQNALFTWEAK